MNRFIITCFLLLTGTTFGQDNPFGQEQPVKPTVQGPPYTIYYYGMPIYMDEDLNKIGLKYSVRWSNLGCEATNEFDEHNRIADSLIQLRHGKDWRERFWTEVEEKLD